MGRVKSSIFGMCAGLALTAAAVAAQGPPADRSTYVTISGPVSLPGITLPAGEYLFRLADTQASRNVVQIFNRDRTKIFATIIAISATRPEASDEAVITFKETPADRAPAVQYWYYAGETSGQEFAYPKSQAMEIAARTGKSVLAVDTASNDIEAMKSGEISRVEPSASASASQSQSTTSPAPTTPAETATPAPAPSPAQQETQSAAPQAPPAQAAAPEQPERETTPAAPTTAQPAPETTPRTGASSASPDRSVGMTSSANPRATGTSGELPRTASSTPLVGFIGLLALGAAIGARALRGAVVSR